MFRILNVFGKSILGCGLALGMLVPLNSAHAEKVLYVFRHALDGHQPMSGLITDSAGNLYGTTQLGGKNYGTVFRLAPDGSETVLYSFAGGSDGAGPLAGLIADSAGNLYGTTAKGGGAGCGGHGCGTVFKLTPDGTETVLYSFAGGNDGISPVAGLITDSAGNLYGTTQLGGKNHFGTVFKLAPDGTETVLYRFCFQGDPCTDGGSPYAGLIKDKAGNLYGTTAEGGTYSGGTVFRLAPDGSETVLYSFARGSDGAYPKAGLIADSAGNLYGTTASGGGTGCGGYGCGTVFKLAPEGTETVLYAFTGNDGAYPEAGVITDSAGNFYGTTQQGGTNDNGTVFKLAPDGTETVLYSFAGGSDGSLPFAGLIADKKGHLYGTTSEGGSTRCYGFGCGTVFKLNK